jgi:hypothetical protein
MIFDKDGFSPLTEASNVLNELLYLNICVKDFLFCKENKL